jgi:hypothetical protein
MSDGLGTTAEARNTMGGGEAPQARYETPPRPRLAFRVGIAGHRPKRLDRADLKRLAECIGKILHAVRDETFAVARNYPTIYEHGTPVLRAISSLAEGADRVFADAAIAAEFTLECVMPFPQAEFEKDFGPHKALENDSLTRFQSLLAKTYSQFELDGARRDEGDAYGTCARVVNNLSDVLIVVWDGEHNRAEAGTEEAFEDAVRRDIPVVWIDAHEPHGWELLEAGSSFPIRHGGKRRQPDGSASFSQLRERVRQILKVPEAAHTAGKKDRGTTKDPAKAVKDFYAERLPRRTPGMAWKAFRQLVADACWPRISLRVPQFEETAIKEWPGDRSTPIKAIVDDLRPFFAWPDNLAVHYGDRHRSAFLTTFLLAAAAVGFALFPLAAELDQYHPLAEGVCLGLEFVIILAILLLVRRVERKRWHQRWIDYRLTAELVRHLRLVAPLCGRRPFPRIPAHWVTYGQPAATWMAWYVRAVERATSLPFAVVNTAYLQEYLEQLKSVVKSQIEYHKHTARRCDNIEKRLHGSGIVLLWLTLIACFMHLVVSEWAGFPLRRWFPRNALTYCCGVFPALGAALAGIVNQGEFRSLTNRSEAMRQRLEQLFKDVERLSTDLNAPAKSRAERPSRRSILLATATANLLVNEILDWRVILLDQPLRPPS